MNNRIVAVILACLVVPLHAATVPPDISSRIEQGLKEIFPDFEITGIRESSIMGLYEVMHGAEIYYVSGDGRYILEGDLYDLRDKENLTDEQRAIARTSMLKGLVSDEYIEFSPQHPSHTVYVFTDTDCSYCRRFHSQISEVNKLGIAVRYLAFPRTGIKEATYARMESVWCSKDRNQALTSAKLGKTPVRMKCANPVSRQYQLGKLMGVRGTPALFTENGKYIGGYLTPEELVEAIEESY